MALAPRNLGVASARAAWQPQTRGIGPELAELNPVSKEHAHAI